MKNRVVGIFVVVISILIGFIILSFNAGLSDIVNASCGHGSECPMWGTIDFQTNVSLGIMAFLMIIGLYLIFFSKEEKIVTRVKLLKRQREPKQITKDNYRKVMKAMSKEEKQVFEKIIDAQGSISQSTLVKETGFSKVKVSRVLDRLEVKSLIERRRRGMSNVIVLKDDETSFK
jgi:hypothetical protein